MTSPFGVIASSYDSLWDGTPSGRSQREEVWRELDRIFLAGERILDLGCGTGTDAVRLESRGVNVHAIDASPEMVAVARSRGVDAHATAIEDLSEIRQSFHGAISNFGALNCVRDLRPVASNLARIIRPGGYVVLCLMTRLCWHETLDALKEFDVKTAFRRWSGSTVWRGTPIYYPRAASIRHIFTTHFEITRTVPIGRGDHRLFILRRRHTC